MNKYKELVKLIEDNNIEIHKKKCYDSQSGWTGEEVILVDKENGFEIFDLSINGYCFDETSVERAIKKVNSYLTSKKMETFEDFKRWVNDNAKVVKWNQK